MSATRRFQLLQWASKTGSWIIEDDYDSEYRYDSMPIASLQGLDHDSRVIYTGTFSKALFPSLRLGYVVVPADLVDRFAAVRQAMDICPSHATQATLAAFIREGHFTRHVRKMRRLYEERRRILVEEIERQFGNSCQMIGAAAGMHLAVTFSQKIRDRELVERAIQKKLWLSPLSASYAGQSPRQGLVLGFGNTPTEQISGKVALLKKILNS